MARRSYLLRGDSRDLDSRPGLDLLTNLAIGKENRRVTGSPSVDVLVLRGDRNRVQEFSGMR